MNHTCIVGFYLAPCIVHPSLNTAREYTTLHHGSSFSLLSFVFFPFFFNERRGSCSGWLLWESTRRFLYYFPNHVTAISDKSISNYTIVSICSARGMRRMRVSPSPDVPLFFSLAPIAVFKCQLPRCGQTRYYFTPLMAGAPTTKTASTALTLAQLEVFYVGLFSLPSSDDYFSFSSFFPSLSACLRFW